MPSGEQSAPEDGDSTDHYTLGNTLRAQGRAADAVAHYQRAIEIDPYHANAHNNLGIALIAQGRIAVAITHYERALAISPNYANAHSNLGMALAAQGGIAEALAHLERAVALDPNHADAHNNLGLALAALGRITDAIAHFERALVLNPNYADGHNNLGLALAAQGRNADAVMQYERALVLNPNHASALGNLGSSLADQGRIADGIACLERALLLNPNHAEVHNSLGVALVKQGRNADGIAHYERALTLNPRLASAHANLGVTLVEDGKFAEAITRLERAQTLDPEHPDIHNNLGVALIAQGRIADAIAHYERALALSSDHANAHGNLGTALVEQGRIADAMPHLERALAKNPNHADVHNTLGNISKHEGKFDDALAHYEKAIAIRPDYGQAYLNLSEIKSFRRGDPELETLEALAGRESLADVKAMNIHFALAKALEDSGEYPRAFEHLRRGNALKRAQIDYDEAAAQSLFERTSAVFTGNLLGRYQGAGDPSTVPIFVLGMPRSGSTLIEQILASHPQIHGAGELPDFDAATDSETDSEVNAAEFPECAAAFDDVTLRRIGQSYLNRLPALADGRIRIVDKLPGNYFNIGLIRLALPNARIIHTLRDPMDTCVSCYSKLFTFGHHYTYDLAELGRFYRCYTELMAHWRSVLPPDAMLDVAYEDVGDDIEGQARRLIDYCGLVWDDRCIHFHQTGRPVKTASSVHVRKPLFRSSLQRWRRYESELAPLLQELGKSREIA